MVQAGGVELVELHVRHPTAGTPRHGDAVAGGAVGIAGVEIDLARAAGGERHARRLEHLHPARVAVEDIGAEGAIAVAAEARCGDHVDGDAAGEDADAGMPAGVLDQRGGDGAARVVGHVQHAATGVAAFAGEVWVSFFAVEGETLSDDAVDGAGAAPHHLLDHRLVAQSAAGGDRVRNVGGEAVVAIGDRGHAPLSAIRGASAHFVFRKHRDFGAVGKVQRKGKAGGAAADDQNIALVTCVHIRCDISVKGATGAKTA